MERNVTDLIEFRHIRERPDVRPRESERLERWPVGDVIEWAQREREEHQKEDEVVGDGEREEEHARRAGRAVAQQHDVRERVARHAHSDHHQIHVDRYEREQRPSDY